MHTDNPAAAVLMVGMAAACLYCARELWVQGDLRTWVLVAIMNIAMIGMHAPFASGHQHGGEVAVAAMPMHPSGVMTLATALAAVEAVIATAVVYQRSRHNRVAVAEAASVAAAGGVARNTTRARAQVAVLEVVAPTAYRASR
jgi:hypothetical protein